MDEGHLLNDTNIFVMIALFNMLVFPLGVLPGSISCLFKCYVSYKRINKFL